MAACLAGGPGAVASHRSAATLLDLPGVVRRLEITVPYPRQVRAEGLIVHRSKHLSAEDLRPIRGIPATAPARTMVDLASIYDGARMGEILDEAAAQRLLTRSELVDSLGRVGPGGRAGAGLVAELLAERPAGRRAMGSRLERRLFGALKGAGLPLPIPQFRIILPGGEERFCDFAFLPPINLGIELVSFRWHGDLHSWADDVERDSEIVAAGWAILPTTSYRIMYQPDRVVEQIGQALAARGVGPLAHR